MAFTPKNEDVSPSFFDIVTPSSLFSLLLFKKFAPIAISPATVIEPPLILIVPPSCAKSPIAASSTVVLSCNSIMLLGPIDRAPNPSIFVFRETSVTSMCPPCTADNAA